MGSKSTNHEIQKRIQVVSLLLRRKSTDFIIKFAKLHWSVEKVQAYNYIKDAKVEWAKYFAHVKKCGMDYHVTQLRDIKDQAYRKKTTIGTGKEKKIVKTPDLGLVFDIAKEEAKLMGAYPVERHEVNLTTNFAQWVKEVKERRDKIGNVGIQKHRPEIIKAESQQHREITNEVPEDAIVEGVLIDTDEESKTHNEIVRRVPEEAVVVGKEEKKFEEDFDLE